MEITSILLLFLVIGFIGTFIYFIFTLTQVKTLEIINLELDCQNSIITLYVKVIGTEEIKPEEIKISIDGKEQLVTFDQRLFPNTLAKIYVNFIPSDISVRTHKLEIYVGGRRIYRNFDYICESLVFNIARSNMTFVAFSSPHWVVFNYITKEYLIFKSNNGDLTAEVGPISGKVPVYENLDNFVVQTQTSSWNNKPLDSPIIIFKNPNLKNVWIFNWTDPHGSFLFKLNPIENAIEDILIFWEDLYNPFNPPSTLDDWKDHVVRVTLVGSNTYRIAVYLAKGGYKHQFYISTESPNPLQGTLTYEKPYGAYWSNKIGNYYEEFRVYYVTIQ
ncbi:MAG: hypothetical protein QXQ14_01585 [Candidatus Aenigmatarchaeota archaeon]